MNRRGFLKLFGAGVATAIVKPSYFFAPVGGWQKGTYTSYLVGADEIFTLSVHESYKMYEYSLSLLGASIRPLIAADMLKGMYMPKSAWESEFGVHFPDTKIISNPYTQNDVLPRLR